VAFAGDSDSVRVKTEIQTIAVIGAGSRGREIALAALRAGYATILEDVSRARLEDAVAWIHQGAAARAITLLRTSGVIEEAVRDADLIIEAAAEEMEVKIELFTLFDKFAKPHAILASSSDSLSIADMASVTFCAERCIGMRFLNSGAKENTLALVTRPETSGETIAACREVGSRMSRNVFIVEDGSAAGRGDLWGKAAGV
jgi:3-hydroxybutyryl-CoA dehydrogenase